MPDSVLPLGQLRACENSVWLPLGEGVSLGCLAGVSHPEQVSVSISCLPLLLCSLEVLGREGGLCADNPQLSLGETEAQKNGQSLWSHKDRMTPSACVDAT